MQAVKVQLHSLAELGCQVWTTTLWAEATDRLPLQVICCRQTTHMKASGMLLRRAISGTWMLTDTCQVRTARSLLSHMHACMHTHVYRILSHLYDPHGSPL